MFDVHRVSAEILGVPWNRSRSRGGTPRGTCRRPASGRQPDDARDDESRARGWEDAKKKLQEIAAKTLRRQPESYQRRKGARVRRRAQHDAGAGGAEGDRTRRPVRRSRTAERRQRLHEAVGNRARRPRADGRGARQLSCATARRIPQLPALPKSKSTSRPATMNCSTSSRSPMSAPSCTRESRRPDPRRRHARHRPRDRLSNGSTTSITASPLAKRLYQNKPPTISMRRRTCSGPRSISPIRKPRSARAASASPRSGRIQRGRQRDRSSDRRRNIPARAGRRRQDPARARDRPADARGVDRERVTLGRRRSTRNPRNRRIICPIRSGPVFRPALGLRQFAIARRPEIPPANINNEQH